jgi:hypothetical protein
MAIQDGWRPEQLPPRSLFSLVAALNVPMFFLIAARISVSIKNIKNKQNSQWTRQTHLLLCKLGKQQSTLLSAFIFN